MRAIIVDDEILAIKYLRKLLEKSGEIEVVDTYTDSSAALEKICESKPDVVFLDIQMPDINGIDLAKKIIEYSSDTKIVFITAYEEYALQAIEIGVVDYIVKPYKAERINKLISRLNGKEYKQKKDEYTICSFKYFHFKKNGEEIRNVKWRSAKSKELLNYLVQNYQETVRKDLLIYMLWPDISIENAYANLYHTVYHLRKLLKSHHIDIDIVSTPHGYRLNFNDVKYDVAEWESTLTSSEITDAETYQRYNETMKYYTGDYLAEETYVWKENEQERLRVKFLAASKVMIDYLLSIGNYTDATLHALHIQRLYPYLDYSYFVLMQLYAKTGDIYNVESQYRKLKIVLEDEFITSPKQEIRDWYQDWMQKQMIL